MAKLAKNKGKGNSLATDLGSSPDVGSVDAVGAPSPAGVSPGVDTKIPKNLISEGQRLLLEDERSVRVLAPVLAVSPATVGHWRTGKRTPDRDQRLKLEGHLGIPLGAWDRLPFTRSQASVPSAPTESVAEQTEGSGLIRLVQTLRERRAQVAGEGRDWVEWGRAELIVLQDEAEACLAQIGDLDRLTCSGAYGAVKAAILATLSGTVPGAFVGDLLPPQPEIGPVSELETHRLSVSALGADAYKELDEGVSMIRPRDVIGLTKLQLDCRRTFERLGVLSTPAALAESAPWGAIELALSRVLAQHVDDRGAVIAALDALPGNALASHAAEVLRKVRHIQFPGTDYRDDPARYCREILGFLPWSKQVEILEAVRDHKYVAIRSGQKTGKSRIMAALALWWYCVWEDGKVLFSNSTGKQLEAINWVEVATLYNRSGRCVECKEEDPHGPRPCPHAQRVDGDCLKSSRGGLKSTNLERTILGIQARDAEGIQGFSGAHLLIVIDEASSLSPALYQAFFGNTAAAGAKMCMVSNPTKTVGPYFDAFHRNAKRWHCVSISSLDAAAECVPGLASMEYCQSVLEEDERGEKSPFYQVRVLGEFPTLDATAVYPIDLILEAEKRWDANLLQTGRLVIAIDPAGESGRGDDSVLTVGRTEIVYRQRVGNGWDDAAHERELRELVKEYAEPGEVPLVVVDADGVGHGLYHYLRTIGETQRCWDVVPAYFGHQAREWRMYDTTGEEMHVALSMWLQAGAIPTISKLEQEMQRIRWILVRKRRFNSELEVQSSTRKAELRKELHRSPDRLDSLRMFAWGVLHRAGIDNFNESAAAVEVKPSTVFERSDESVAVMDPYAGVDQWSK